jgi:hypothetical protein
MSIVDQNGKSRIRNGTAPGLEPVASFAGDFVYDANGPNGAVTGIDEDPTHNFRGLFVNDASGKNRVAGGEIISNANAGFFVRDTNGIERADVAIDGAGLGAAHAVWDANGKLETTLFGNADHSSTGLDILDAAGNVIWFAPEPVGQ